MLMRKTKIRTMRGKILTIEVTEENETHIFGIDKFGERVILPLHEIDEMTPIK